MGRKLCPHRQSRLGGLTYYMPSAKLSTQNTPAVNPLRKSVQSKRKHPTEQPPLRDEDIYQPKNPSVLTRCEPVRLGQNSTLKLQSSTATESVFYFAYSCLYTHTRVRICVLQPVSVTQPMKSHRQLFAHPSRRYFFSVEQTLHLFSRNCKRQLLGLAPSPQQKHCLLIQQEITFARIDSCGFVFSSQIKNQ